MIDKLIRCTDCNRLTVSHKRLWHFDESLPLPGVEWSAEDVEEQKRFTAEHQAHPLEEIQVDWESYVSDRPAHEPVKVSYFEATNGRDRFLIKRTKSGLDRPARYEIIPGRIRITPASISIQERDLQRQIAREKDSLPLTEDQLKIFIAALREEVQSIPPEKFIAEAENVEEGDTPLVSYGSLKDAHWEKVFRRCQDRFQPSELKALREFVRQNNHPGCVLSLKIQRRFSISP